MKDIMEEIIESIIDFISKLTAIAVIGTALTVIAGEVRLAALKKASEGSSKLTSFTEHMTGITLFKGGHHGIGKKSN